MLTWERWVWAYDCFTRCLYFEVCLLWCWDILVSRWCTFGPCLSHVLDLRWRQVNIAMWSTRFNFVIWIASFKFQKLTLAKKDLNFGFILSYMLIYLWHCSWSYKFWRYMKFMHCSHTFALSYWWCIWRNRSRIGAVKVPVQQHTLRYSNVVEVITSFLGICG